MAIVTVHGEKKYVQGTTYETIAADYQEAYSSMIAVAVANNKIRELFKRREAVQQGYDKAAVWRAGGATYI